MVLDTDALTALYGSKEPNAAVTPEQVGNGMKFDTRMEFDKKMQTDTRMELSKKSEDMELGKEMELVKHYVLLGIVNAVLEHDIRIVGAASTKLPRLYECMMRGLQDRVLLELAGMRRQFKASGIGVCEEKRTKESLTASYRCMGYLRTFSMPWAFVKAESERLLKGYLEKKRE